MKERVAIMTWWGNWALNYGSALQATAMQELLRRENCIPITIDFMHMGRTRKEIINALLERGIQYARTYFRFQNWYKRYMNISPKCYCDEDIINYAKENSDILLCGSDCIWADKNNGGAKMFWDYEALDSLPHIAYAVGNDNTVITYDMSRVINTYVAMAGRDLTATEVMKKYRKDAELVLDPTLTVGSEYWDKRAAKRLIKGDYIVCYMLSGVEKNYIAIEKLKNKYQVKRVVYINTDFVDKPCNEVFSDYRGGECKKTVGPAEFLSLIKYSKAVCTDSYHATCFSLIFKKEFYLFGLTRIPNGELDSRFQTLDKLLDRSLGLDKRYIRYNSDIDDVETINWNEVEQKLEKMRIHSVEYLRKALAKC